MSTFSCNVQWQNLCTISIENQAFFVSYFWQFLHLKRQYCSFFLFLASNFLQIRTKNERKPLMINFFFSMSKLLQALDQAIRTDFEGVKEAVMDKTYMGQLVAVQHQRGAQGGHIFAGLMMLDAQC